MRFGSLMATFPLWEFAVLVEIRKSIRTCFFDSFLALFGATHHPYAGALPEQ
jgi:hypothetical protein